MTTMSSLYSVCILWYGIFIMDKNRIYLMPQIHSADTFFVFVFLFAILPRTKGNRGEGVVEWDFAK